MKKVQEEQNFIKSLYNKWNNNDYCLNFRMYIFKDSKFNFLNKDQLNYLLSMKNQVINDLPFLGNFCTSKLVLNNIYINDDILNYDFVLEEPTIKHQDGYPVKVVSKYTLICKQYLNRDIVVIISKFFTDYNFLLSILYTLPDFIILKTNLGLDFKYTIPKFKELFLERSMLEFLKTALTDSLNIYKYSIDEYEFDIITLSSNFNESEVTTLKTSPWKKNTLNSINFYYKNNSGNKKNFTITNKACIFSDICMNEDIFYSLLNIIYLITKNSYYINFLTPLKLIINEYCNYIHKDMYSSARNLQLQIITQEFKDILFNNYKISASLSTEIYISAAFNVFIKLYNSKTEVQNTINFEIFEYPSLVNFIKIYIKNKYKYLLQDEAIIHMLCKLHNILKHSKNEEDLINFYKNTYSNS